LQMCLDQRSPRPARIQSQAMRKSDSSFTSNLSSYLRHRCCHRPQPHHQTTLP
jgi:hypothetical protein